MPWFDEYGLLPGRGAPGRGVPAARGALQGYRNRWSALRDAVLETEPTFREDLLAAVPAVDLLVERGSSRPDVPADQT